VTISTLVFNAVVLEQAGREQSGVAWTDDSNARAQEVFAANPNRYPSLRRSLPALFALTQDDIFEYGLAAVLDGLSTTLGLPTREAARAGRQSRNRASR
jgi:hypothetical protein